MRASIVSVATTAPTIPHPTAMTSAAQRTRPAGMPGQSLDRRGRPSRSQIATAVELTVKDASAPATKTAPIQPNANGPATSTSEPRRPGRATTAPTSTKATPTGM